MDLRGTALAAETVDRSKPEGLGTVGDAAALSVWLVSRDIPDLGRSVADGRRYFGSRPVFSEAELFKQMDHHELIK